MKTYKTGILAFASTPDGHGHLDAGNFFLDMTPEQINDEAFVESTLAKWRQDVADELHISVEEVVSITPEQSEELVNEARARAMSEMGGGLFGFLSGMFGDDGDCDCDDCDGCDDDDEESF